MCIRDSSSPYRSLARSASRRRAVGRSSLPNPYGSVAGPVPLRRSPAVLPFRRPSSGEPSPPDSPYRTSGRCGSPYGSRARGCSPYRPSARGSPPPPPPSSPGGAEVPQSSSSAAGRRRSGPVRSGRGPGVPPRACSSRVRSVGWLACLSPNSVSRAAGRVCAQNSHSGLIQPSTRGPPSFRRFSSSFSWRGAMRSTSSTKSGSGVLPARARPSGWAPMSLRQ